MLERKAPAPAAKPDPLPERSTEDSRPGPFAGRAPKRSNSPAAWRPQQQAASKKAQTSLDRPMLPGQRERAK